MELLAIAAVVLLGLGVIGTLVPLVPGGLLSFFGVVVYWYASGYQQPDTLLFILLTTTALIALAVDYLGGAIGAKTAGASTRTVFLASIVGVIGLVVGGPVGLLIGVVGTTYALEAMEHGHGEETARAAVAAGIGVLASAAVQLILTGIVLVAMTAIALGWI